MKKKFWYFIFKFQHVFGLYWWWSRLFQKMWQRKTIKQYPVRYTDYQTFKDLEKALAFAQWRADDWHALGDAISAPERFQKLLDTKKQFEANLDCDDFSNYAMRIVKYLFARDTKRLGEHDNKKLLEGPYMLSCLWFKRDGKQAGHNICAFKYRDLSDNQEWWAWVSNWYEGKVQWRVQDLQAMCKIMSQQGEFIAAQTAKFDDKKRLVRSKFLKSLAAPFKHLNWIWS